MLKLSPILIAPLCVCSIAFAQSNRITVSSSAFTDAAGVGVNNATLTWTPTTCSAFGSGIGFRSAGGGQSVGSPVSVTVSGGAFSVTLPNVAKTDPVNVGFTLALMDNVSGDIIPLGTGYGCVQPSSALYAQNWCSTTNGVTSCNFDKYGPDTAAVASLTLGDQGNQGIPGPAGPAATGYITVDSFPGNDLGAKITAAYTAYAGAPAVFEIAGAGTVSTPFTLSPGHSLTIKAPLNWTGTALGTLKGNNTISCAGATAIQTTNLSTNLFTSGSGGATNLAVHNCYVLSQSNTGIYLLDGNAGATHVLMDGNHLTGMGIYSALGSTNDDLTFTDNSASGMQFGVYLTGATTHIRGTGNHFTGGTHGIELYGHAVASGDPNLAAIMAVGDPAYFTFTNNTCEGVGGACIWTSTSHDGVIANNVAHGCGDVCFDAEGSAYITFDSNYATGAGNFEYSTFYSDYYVRFLNNVAHSSGEEMFRIKYDGGIGAYGTEYEDIIGNQFICDAASGCPGAVVLEGNQWTTFARNHLINAGIQDIGNVSVGLKVIDNIVDWYVRTSAGLVIPSSLNGPPDYIVGNVITSYVGQASGTPGMQVDSSDYNTVDVYALDGNKIQGAWPVDFRLVNNGGNVPAVFYLRNNTLNTNVISTAGNSGVGIVGHGNNNCTLGNTCY